MADYLLLKMGGVLVYLFTAACSFALVALLYCFHQLARWLRR